MAERGVSRDSFSSEGYTRLFNNSPVDAVANVQQDESWLSCHIIEDPRFQRAIGAVIVVNVMEMWAETDLPDWQTWLWLDNVFLVIFIVELAMRIRHHSWRGFFCEIAPIWAAFDTALVILGILDLWLLPILIGYTLVLKHVRLLRVLRFLRVFQMYENLLAFAQALGKMMNMFTWIFLLLLCFLFSVAVVLVPYIGHSNHWDDNLERSESIFLRRNFETMASGLFSLFMLTTIDNWDELADPLITTSVWWRLFFVMFICLASWTMTAVLAAEASNQIIEATNKRKADEVMIKEKLRKEFIHFLRDAFLDADVDGNGLLDKEEFQALMEKDFVIKRMKDWDIHLSQDELLKAWDMLDVDDSGELTIDEFVDGLGCLQEGLATKHIVNVDYSLKRVERQVELKMASIHESMMSVKQQNEAILEVVRKQEHRDAMHQPSLWLWQRWASTSRDFSKAVSSSMPQLNLGPRPPVDLSSLRAAYDNSPYLRQTPTGRKASLVSVSSMS